MLIGNSDTVILKANDDHHKSKFSLYLSVFYTYSNSTDQEHPMSTASYSSTPTEGFRHYLADVSNAARAFAAALFAARERQFITQEVAVKPGITERARMKSHLKLLAMAKDYEHAHPSLASELRNLASRG